VQGTAGPQLPVESQVSIAVSPAHSAWPGPHTPPHVPATQVLPAAHALPLFCQVPVESHVCGCWTLHCTVPGVHTPVHAPLAHAWPVHGTGVPHVPDVQVCTA
jgi:hypothetical protein